MQRLYITIIIAFLSSLGVIGQNASTKLGHALGLMQQGNIEESVAILNRLATTNNIIAQFYIAQCHEYGIGMNKSETDAFMMYRRAAERGFAPAMLELAKCYAEGIGVDKNQDKSKEWMQRYNSKNNSQPLPDLISLYNEGIANTPLIAQQTIVQATKNDPKPNQQPIHQAQATPSHEPITLIEKPTPQDNIATFPKSDVDIDIPVVGNNNETTFAIIIANENYQNVVTVPNAINDGVIFAEYCNKILGIPNEHIKISKDATYANIRGQLNWIREVSKAYGEDASYVIYYAGHGFPDEQNKTGYILPIDGITADLFTCLSLDDLYKILGELQSNKIVVLLDACFSGAQRGDGMLASARGIAIKSKPGSPIGKTVVISSAQGDETAYPYKEQNHGLFTYYLLKKLKESKGDVSLGELVDYITDNVTKKSIVVNGKSQTPTANPSTTVINEWTNWTLNH